MTELAPSPLMVALIQTAGALPVLLLSFAAGALADIVDRRRLLIFSQSWMLVAAAGLGILTVFHLTSPLLLLDLHFSPGLWQRLDRTGLAGDRAGTRSPRRGGRRRLDQLGGLQCGASRGSGAGRTGGRRRRFRGGFSAERRFVPGRHRGVLPLAPQAPQERPAGGARAWEPCGPDGATWPTLPPSARRWSASPCSCLGRAPFGAWCRCLHARTWGAGRQATASCSDFLDRERCSAGRFCRACNGDWASSVC